jgi:RimJ/RimL family protein N-acetyltransferase
MKQLIDYIETDKLLLKRPSIEDGLILRGLWKDEKVRRFLGGVIPNERIEMKIVSIQDQWDKHHFGQWSVLDKTGGQVIGICGLHHSEDGIELSYMFFPEAWGRGLATEAAQASIDHGFNVVELSKIIAITQEANTYSRGLLEKIGMTLINNFSRYEVNQCLYEIQKKIST